MILLSALFCFLLIFYLALINKIAVAGERNAFICIIYDKVAASQLNGDIITFTAKAPFNSGYYSSAGARTAGERFAVSSLPHSHFQGGRIYHSYKFGIYPLRE